MKIAVIHSFYREGPSGENNLVKEESRVLREAGHDVRLISTSTDELMRSRLFPLRAGLNVATGSGPSPKNEIDAFQPDVIQLHNLFPNWSDRWLGENRFPVVSTLHNFRPICAAGTLSRQGKFCDSCPRSGSHNAVLHSCYQDSALKSIPLAMATRNPGANRVLTFSDKLIMRSQVALDLYETLTESELASKTAIIPNFVAPTESPGIAGKNGTGGKWLYVGRLSPEKGVKEMVDGWPAHVPLEIFGSGPLRTELLVAARGKRIALMGPLPRSDVRAAMSEAEGLVFPSVWPELAPLTFIEALSAGLPVIAKSGNAAAEEIATSHCGAIFEDFRNIGVAIDRVKANRLEFSRNSILTHREKYSPEAWLEKITGVYRSVSGGRP